MQTVTVPASFDRTLRRADRFLKCLPLSVLFLLLAGLSAQAQLDTDGDGLSNADEAAIYFTNPALADTDGDGMPDGLETQLGTDPRNPGSALRMAAPVSLAGGARRFCWTSQVGKIYHFQNADPRTNGPGGGWVWRTISQVTATSGNTCLDLVNPSGVYRVQVMVSTNNDVLPPLVSLPQAIPPGPGGSSAFLSVVARDLAGVVRVEFLDGANVLGIATRGAGDAWSFSWPLNINLNGRHYLRARAYDMAGNVGYSPTFAFNVSLGAQTCVTVGAVQVCADSIVATAGTLRATGHVRVGGITFSAETVLTIAGSQISGTGSVNVPGLGTVLTGSFDINTQTGWLTVRAGTTPIYNGIVFSPRITMNPTQLLLNVFSNSLCTSGSVTCQVPNHAFGPATFTGSVCFDPVAATVTAVGSMSMSSLTATGTATLLLKDATFILAGDAQLRASNGDVYTISNGLARLTISSTLVPNLYVQGRLGFPEGLALNVQGNIAADGSALITGSGSGRINGYTFTTLDCTITRPAGLNVLITVRFNGRLAHTNLSNFTLTGTLLSSGVLDAAGSGSATFNGFTFTPFNIHAFGNVFSNQLTIGLSGRLSLNYLEPIDFEGTLLTDGSIQITGRSGPYTVATFGGAVPRWDDPALTFDKKIFAGCYYLLSRNVALSTTVGFLFAGNTNTANYTLFVTAVTTNPGAPTLTLTGTAATSGACSLGALVNQNTPLYGYPVGSLECQVSRAPNGTATFGIAGRVSAPAFNPGFSSPATFTVSGALNGDGSFNLTGQGASSLALTGLPVGAVNASQTGGVNFRNTGLTINGIVSGGVLGQVPAVTALGNLAVASTGLITLSGCIQVSPLTYGQFRLESTAPGGVFNACFGPGGLTFPSGARLLYRGLPLSGSLPTFTIAVDGSFSMNVNLLFGITLDGFTLSPANFTFRHSGSITVVENLQATLRVPGSALGFTGATTFVVSGNLNSDGTFNLTGTGGSSLALTGLPVGTVNASAAASVNFRETGLTIGGTLSGGLLSLVPTQATAGSGFLAEYFDNMTLSGPKVTRIDPRIDFDWGVGQPDPAIGPDTFSVRWTGWVRPEFSEVYTFYTTSDDGVRLWVNNQLLIDNWTDHAPTEDSASIALQAGAAYQVRMEFFENGVGAVARLDWSSPSRPREIIPSSRVAQPSAVGGLLGEYFDNMDFSGAQVTRVDSTVDFDWGNGQPVSGIDVDTFSTRWTGWVRPQFSETYTFYTTSDDGVRLWVNDQLIIDNWTEHAPTENSGTITLQAGAYYQIRMEFFENGVGAVARLAWSSPSQSRETIPTTRLFQSSAVAGISGFLNVEANGTVTVAGCVSVSPLVYGQFRLESTQPGGNFTACFGPDDLTFPRGARLYYRGLPITLPELPSFNISANGNFSLHVSAEMTAGMQLNGFNLPSLTFDLVHTASFTAVQNLTATVNVPGFSPGFSGGAAFGVSGNLNSDGTYNLTGTSSGNMTLSGLPIGSMNANGANNVSLRETGLTVTALFAGNVLNRVPAGFNANGTLTIRSDGAATLNGSLTCLPLQSGGITVERLGGGDLQATLDNSGLRFSSWQVRVAGVFNVPVPLPAAFMNLDGRFNITVTGAPAGLTVAGFGFANVSFTLNRSTTGVLSITSFNGTLFNVSGFNHRFLNGSIDNAGNVTMDLDVPVTLGGFTSTSNGHLSLRGSVLTASGNFTIAFGKVSGSFSANVVVSPTGGYNGSVNVSLTIDGYTTSGSPMTLGSGGLNGSRTLKFGNLSVTMSLTIGPSAISGSGSAAADTDWKKFVDAPFTDAGDLWGRLEGNVGLSLSSDGGVNASHTLTLHWWWGRFFSDPPQWPGQTWSVTNTLGIGRDGHMTFTHGVTCSCGTFFDSWVFDLR